MRVRIVFSGILVLCGATTFAAEPARARPAARPAAPAAASAKAPAATPQTEGDWEYAVLQSDLRRKPFFHQVSAEVQHREALILDSDRDPLDVVLRRTEALVKDLRQAPNCPDLAACEAELRVLQAKASQTEAAEEPARRALFDAACRIRRRIALANPLLDFSELLLLKRSSLGAGHMCDQYYGITQTPGGGLFVLSEAFGAQPRERDILAEAQAVNGRLKGQKLEPSGSFLSPSLSFDAQTVAFAYVELQGVNGHQANSSPTQGPWPLQRSYHLFRVNVDGTDLRQLSDGTWDDFDPCFMPSGRIAFISERRGGYLRCGRTCPTYTLFDMAADGSNIRCLSYHETNEWHPSVTNDGLIIWTRWDYVDRHGCATHMPWLTTPDGRDPRPVHGNYTPRRDRPDMEVNVRAIPGSPRFVATAAPHHGQSFGSLVIIDPDVRDNDGMAPVRRLTPDCGFPESQGGGRAYGQAWPLSEKYFLCVYSPGSALGGKAGGGHFGIYLLDAFGNRELIYRDPKSMVFNPLPLRPRPVPPLVPSASQPVDITSTAPAEGTVAVLDVYKSLKPWPAGTTIKALRVVQVFPLSTPCAAIRNCTGVGIPEAADSINIARGVLGTVPVEEDGSAYFTVPARKEIFFQALDENGLAVQSMRSGTHLQPGETLSCAGCHEPKHTVVPGMRPAASALRRAPSRLLGDVDGTNPVSYPRLIQPVLDKYCLACHTKEAPKAPRLDAQVVHYAGPFARNSACFASYQSLARSYGFYSYGDPYRTTPGRFGARASKLYPMLLQGHHGVKLAPEDLHRFAVWLDMCSPFFGINDIQGQEAALRGEAVRPSLE